MISSGSSTPGRRRPRFAVVDYGAGNLVSIDQALTRVGADVRIAHSADDLADADALLVPGVGAAGPAMARLDAGGLVEPIRDWIVAGRPYLGICLGMQLLFEGSDEDGTPTLGVIRGRTERLTAAPRLPHIGWNQVERTREHALFVGIAPAADFYFVHSFAGVPDGPDGEAAVLARTTHGSTFVSAIAQDNVIGLQFHPERSGADGLRLLANVVRLVADGRLDGPAIGAEASQAAATAPTAGRAG